MALMGTIERIVTNGMTRELRESVKIEMMRQDVTQTELAERVGVSRQYMSKLLRGHVDGSVDTWRRILDALGMQLRAVKRDSA